MLKLPTERTNEAFEAAVLRDDLPYQIAAGLIPAAVIAIVLGVSQRWRGLSLAWWVLLTSFAIGGGLLLGALARRSGLKQLRAMGRRYEAEETRVEALAKRAQTDPVAAREYVQELDRTLASLRAARLTRPGSNDASLMALIARAEGELARAKHLLRGTA